jgi:hypothetical protein
LARGRWIIYAVVAIAALVPAFWQWPAAYPWDHDSPCTTQTAAALTATARGALPTSALRTPTPTITSAKPAACVGLATLVARRSETAVPTVNR